MKYRCLGRTGIKVSEISLGTVELGMQYGIPVQGRHLKPSQVEAEAILNKALDLGINLIDTARAYGDSEAIIGRALASRRHEYILASKVDYRQNPNRGNSTLHEQIVASVHESLDALQTDFIDIMQIHSASAEVIRQGEVAEVLQQLQAEGIIRFIGVTVYGEEAALAAIRAGTYDCVQIAYSVLDRQPETQILPEAMSSGVGVVARSVLLKGALTSRHMHLPPTLGELQAAAKQMAALAERQSLTLTELAYRYVLSCPTVSTALVGASSREELETAAGFSGEPCLSINCLEEVRNIHVNRREQLNPANWPIQ